MQSGRNFVREIPPSSETSSDMDVLNTPDIAAPEVSSLHQKTSPDISSARDSARRLAQDAREMKDPLLVTIESYLSQGLDAQYQELSPEARTRFRAEGEVLAQWVHDALRARTLHRPALMKRIDAWLRIVDGRSFSPWRVQQTFNCAREIFQEVDL